MRVAVVQSSYLPWRGFFDIISQVDLFVFYDDVQFSKGSWRNRNQFKTRSGLRWVTVPVHRDGLSVRICDTRINDATDWRRKHIDLFRENYYACPYFGDASELLEALLSEKYETISELNKGATRAVCRYFKIRTELICSTDFPLAGSKSDRLIDLLGQVGADMYLSGPSAKDYLDENKFRDDGILLEYKTYDYSAYSQPWGPFVSEVSIIDLIANCGPDGRRFMRSNSSNVRVVL